MIYGSKIILAIVTFINTHTKKLFIFIFKIWMPIKVYKTSNDSATDIPSPFLSTPNPN